MQGSYKIFRCFDDIIFGSKGNERRAELLFKMALTASLAMAVHGWGKDDDDYKEAPDYEWQNFWILPGGRRISKDQVFGKMIGTTVEMALRQLDKEGKIDKWKLAQNVMLAFKPDGLMPASVSLALGLAGNYDFYRQKSIVPYFMEGKVGYKQYDINTRELSKDISKFLFDKFGWDLSAKKIDWAFQAEITNANKYLQSVYDLGKETVTGKKNERMARGGKYGWLRDEVPTVMGLNHITGTFVTNNTTYQSISDFYEKYKDMQRFAKMTKGGKVEIEKDSDGKPLVDEREFKRFAEADKKMRKMNKSLKEIKESEKLSGADKRAKADPIFKQQIKLSKWAMGRKD